MIFRGRFIAIIIYSFPAVRAATALLLLIRGAYDTDIRHCLLCDVNDFGWVICMELSLMELEKKKNHKRPAVVTPYVTYDIFVIRPETWKSVTWRQRRRRRSPSRDHGCGVDQKIGGGESRGLRRYRYRFFFFFQIEIIDETLEGDLCVSRWMINDRLNGHVSERFEFTINRRPSAAGSPRYDFVTEIIHVYILNCNDFLRRYYIFFSSSSSSRIVLLPRIIFLVR